MKILGRVCAALTIVVAAAFLLPSRGFAQGTVLQSGPMVPGHVPMYLSPGGNTQATLFDSGPAGGAAIGYGLSEELLQARGPGTGPLGEHRCDWSTYATNPAGAYYLCFDPFAQGGGLIDYGSTGPVSPQPLTIVVNGVPTTLPFTSPGFPLNPAAKPFNCKGDGTTNDTACWQAILAAAGATHATISVPPHFMSYVNQPLSDGGAPIIIHGNNPPSTNDGNSSVCVSGFTNVAGGVPGNITILTLNGEGSSIDHVCFQSGVSTSVPVAGGGLSLAASAVEPAGFQSAQWNTFYYPYVGISLGGTVFGTGTQSPDVEHNWIASPVQAGVSVGAQSAGAQTINVTMLDNRVTCNAAAPALYGFVIYDGAIDHWNGNDATDCDEGTSILPGTAGGHGQHVLGHFQGIMGDTSVGPDLHIAATTPLGLANLLWMDGIWLGGNTTTQHQVALIENPGGGTERVNSITVTGGIGHVNANVPIWDLENDVAMVHISNMHLSQTAGNNFFGTAIKFNSSGHGNSFLDNHMDPINGNLNVGAEVDSTVTGYLDISGNDFSTVNTPIVWNQPATTPLNNIQIKDNIPLSTTGVVVASATTVSNPEMAELVNITGNVTIDNLTIGGFWQNKVLWVTLSNGASLNSAANPSPGAFCNTLAAQPPNTMVRLQYAMGTPCWIVGATTN